MTEPTETGPWTADGRLKPHAIPAATTLDQPSMTGGFDSTIEIQKEIATDQTAPVCKFDEGCHRVAPCEPGCGAVEPATDQAAPAAWIDGHPQLEAIAAAVWEQCGRSDSGLVIDDPRNIAVAALAAVRCGSCEHEAQYHDVDGRCWFTVEQGVPGRDAVCSCQLRRMAAESAPAETGHDDSETEGEAPPVCEGFIWIGQPFTTCDRCGQPAWEHEGEEVPVEGAGPFDNRRTVRPWKPGQADAIRAKWAPEQPDAAQQQPKEA